MKYYQILLFLPAYAALDYFDATLDATRLLPASAEDFFVCFDAAEGFLSDMRGMGTSETAETWTSSKNFLKSRSDITFLADDFYSSLSCGRYFFSGVDGAAGCLTFALTFSAFTSILLLAFAEAAALIPVVLLASAGFVGVDLFAADAGSFFTGVSFAALCFFAVVVCAGDLALVALADFIL